MNHQWAWLGPYGTTWKGFKFRNFLSVPGVHHIYTPAIHGIPVIGNMAQEPEIFGKCYHGSSVGFTVSQLSKPCKLCAVNWLYCFELRFDVSNEIPWNWLHFGLSWSPLPRGRISSRKRKRRGTPPVKKRAMHCRPRARPTCLIMKKRMEKTGRC